MRRVVCHRQQARCSGWGPGQARGLEPAAAVASAVFLHGLAGDVAAERVGAESLVAGDLIEALPEAFRRVGAGH